MSLTADGFAIIFAAAAGVGASWLTNRHARRTDAARTIIDEGALELDARRVDGAAYERAQQINQQLVAGYREMVSALRQELATLQQTIDGLRNELTDERHRNAELEGHIRQLEDTAAVMRRLLKDRGVDFPPPNQEVH